MLDDSYHLTMEVTNQRVAYLSNFEVLDLLKGMQEKSKRRHSNGRSQNVATITYEASEYLSGSPCAKQSNSIVKDFMESMKKYKLSRTEKLQLLNLKPETHVELQLVIEDLEDRFSEEDIAKLLELIAKLLETESSMET